MLPIHWNKLDLSTVIAAGFSLACCLLATAFVFPRIGNDASVGSLFVIQNLVIIGFLVLVSLRFHRNAEKRERQLSEWHTNRLLIPKMIHCFVHDARNFLTNEDEHHYEYFAVASQLQKACNYLKAIFDALNKQDNAVTVKMRHSGDNMISIARDERTAKLRKQEKSHPISENTAFRSISNPDLDKSRCYLNNDLLNDSQYNNTTEDWRDRYTSTLVVPVRRGQVVIGCLAVDCKRGQGQRSDTLVSHSAEDPYNDSNHVEIMAIFADLIFYILFKAVTTPKPGGQGKSEGN